MSMSHRMTVKQNAMSIHEAWRMLEGSKDVLNHVVFTQILCGECFPPSKKLPWADAASPSSEVPEAMPPGFVYFEDLRIANAGGDIELLDHIRDLCYT